MIGIPLSNTKSSYFYHKHATMRLFRLTVLGSLSIALLAGLASCEKDSEKEKVNYYAKSDIPMTGAQIAPTPSPSTGTGKLSVTYDKRGKVLNYTLSWTGLSDSVIAIRLNGPAPTGYSALDPTFNPPTNPVPANWGLYTTTPYKVIQVFTGTAPKALYPATGSFTGSINIDDVKVRELDLLNNLYYFTIHTKTMLPVAAPGSYLYRWFGEIRAQVVFQ